MDAPEQKRKTIETNPNLHSFLRDGNCNETDVLYNIT